MEFKLKFIFFFIFLASSSDCKPKTDKSLEKGEAKTTEKNESIEKGKISGTSSKLGRMLTLTTIGTSFLALQAAGIAHGQNDVGFLPNKQNPINSLNHQPNNFENKIFLDEMKTKKKEKNRKTKEIEKEILLKDEKKGERKNLMEMTTFENAYKLTENQQQKREWNDEPIVYEGVTDGCSLIKCPNWAACEIRKGIAMLGNGPFVQFDYPKCITNPYELSHNTDPDGNAKIITNGPGCNLVHCANGFECQVRISISKFGVPYAQGIGGFPQCVSSTNPYKSSNAIIEDGPGCDKIPKCPSGEKCKVAMGIAKYGYLQWSQFFWPYCE